METLDGAVEGFDLTQTYKNGKSVQELGEVTDLTYENWEHHMIWSTHITHHTAIFFLSKRRWCQRVSSNKLRIHPPQIWP